MITAHFKGDHSYSKLALKSGDPLPVSTVWIDLFNPTAEEDRHVEALIGIAIPTREDMAEIEESSRFYAEHDAQYLTAPLVHATATPKPGVSPVTFIIVGGRLVTVRYAAPTAFSLFENRLAKQGNEFLGAQVDGITLLTGLLETVTDRLADLLEGVAVHLDTEADDLFAESKTPMSTPRFRSAMRLLGTQGAFLSKVGESLQGLIRLVTYLNAENAVSGKKKALKNRLAVLERDMQSLIRHAEFLSNKITLLLDTVVGLVSVEQNAIIKIFSVAAVGFMPPTLVASIYGMNFHFMPELDWPYGYPLALVLMVLSALLPLLFFRHKGWL